MEKLTAYKIAAITMLCLNCILLTFLYLGRPSAHGQKPGRALDRLDVSDAQRDTFRQKADIHRNATRQMNDDQRRLLRNYFSQLKEGTPQESPAVPPAILQLEKQKITVTYQHLLEIRQLLQPAQLAGYNEFVDLAIGRILGKNGQHQPPSAGPKKQ